MPTDSRSFAGVIQDIIQNVQDIVRSEVRLAKAEITNESKKAARAGAVLAAGAVLGLYALGFLLLAAVYGLSLALPAWAAALIVGAVIAVIAAIMIIAGRARMKNVHARPETTIRSVKENIEWLKTQTR
jgi:uncharacterized membrane protein YqjE